MRSRVVGAQEQSLDGRRRPDASERRAPDRLVGAAIAGSRSLDYGREVGYSRPWLGEAAGNGRGRKANASRLD